MKSVILSIVPVAFVMVLGTGCERNITNQVANPDSTGVSACFTCHSDQDFELVAAQEQYAESIHGAGENSNRNRLGAAFYQACEKCHTHEGFVAEVTGVPAAGDNFTAIGCFTCHEPHSTGTLARRVEAAVTLANGVTFDRGKANLCVSCHQSRRDVTTTVVDGVTLSSHWGPHLSNQGDMLIGENSYEFAGFTYTKSPHSNVAANGCIDCHMSASMHATVGGHSWNMHNEDRGFENRTGCNVTTCHDGAITTLDRLADADFDGNGTIEGIQTEVKNLADSLGVLLVGAGLLDTAGHPVGGVVVSTADSAGALYNYLFIEEDRSWGVHNTDYAVGLLQSSINFLVTGNPNGSPAFRPRGIVARSR